MKAVNARQQDGTLMRMVPRPDNRPGFGMQAPVMDSAQVMMPSTKRADVRVVQEEATLHGRLKFATTVSGTGLAAQTGSATRTSSVEYDLDASKRWVKLTPPSGAARAVQVYVDAFGRDSFTVLPSGLEPVKVRRGSRGLVDSVIVGTRRWTCPSAARALCLRREAQLPGA